MASKRITYISHLTPGVSLDQVQAIGAVSQRNNHAVGITGVLIYTAGIFFQIIEGEETVLDPLYHKISADPRHAEVLRLHTEHNVTERMFPTWDMQVVSLDQANDWLAHPVRALLQHLAQTHLIIRRYTHPSVYHWLDNGLNPLQVAPRRCDKIILFSDIAAFSRLSERLEAEQIADLLNTYLELCSQIIMAHGGEVSKYIGDCVMAHFEPAQADTAVRAGLEIVLKLARLRQTAPPDSALRVLYCGVGLAAGMVLEGNIGSSFKLDYTVLGDTVNTAARLESLTRELHSPLLFTDAMKNACREAWDFQAVGSHAVKNKTEPVLVYTLAELAGIQDSALVQQAVRLHFAN